ncbi:hypothetical protein SDIAM103S_04287 [Streptomyces diastaticus subsp. diastaticus]|nr:hypothetical protein [Streptomyces sp. DSM 41037]
MPPARPLLRTPALQSVKGTAEAADTEVDGRDARVPGHPRTRTIHR